MSAKTLIAYASKHGSTEEIAQKVQEQLSKAGVDTDLKSVEKVEDLTAYENIIIGAALYMGMWYKPSKKFVQKFLDELKDKRVWIFSSGPTGEGDPVEMMEGWDRPVNAKDEIEQIDPIDMTVFHGNLDTKKIGIAEKLIIKGVKAPTGDFRDWDMVAKWVEKLAEEIG